jgi:hypothetical protein
MPEMGVYSEEKNQQGVRMQDESQDHQVEQVAANTVAAVHRRDHHHEPAQACCHPHAVEVVHLGQRAVTVCHDCEADSGFLPERAAESLANRHREQTLGEGSSPLSAAVA